MRNTYACLLILGLWLFFSPGRSTAQNPTDAGKDFWGGKFLFMDYGTPNSLDTLDVTYGLELFYKRHLSQRFAIGVPFKVGFANVEGDLNNRIVASLDGILQLQFYDPYKKVVPYLFAGGGITLESEGTANPQIPLGLGADIKVGENSYLNIQGEYRISGEEFRNNIQAGIGMVFRLGPALGDRDGDGITDGLDGCPDEPGPQSTSGCPDDDGDGLANIVDKCPNEPGPEAAGGCPDDDGDGVINSEDECPDEAGSPGAKGCPDQDGDGVPDKDDQCPEDPGTAETQGCPDRDGDGVIDPQDGCPDRPGSAENQGCPDEVAPKPTNAEGEIIRDSDGDGINDDVDPCPNEAGPVNGCPDRDGDGVADKDDLCPDKAGAFSGCPDTDGDGVMDAEDGCPEQAGSLANMGCPDLEPEEKEVLNFAMRNIQFETAEARLKTESYEILNEIIEIMDRYPGYKLRIKGHTDSRGDDQTNLLLSEERAKSCFQYLVAKGVSPLRISYIGYGESRPIADNLTRMGRLYNRRVEFEMYTRE